MNKEIITEEICQSEDIWGYLNQLKTGFEKISNIYHIKNGQNIKNNGKSWQNIRLPNSNTKAYNPNKYERRIIWKNKYTRHRHYIRK